MAMVFLAMTETLPHTSSSPKTPYISQGHFFRIDPHDTFRVATRELAGESPSFIQIAEKHHQLALEVEDGVGGQTDVLGVEAKVLEQFIG
jgi:hypothetical protein